MQLGFSSRCSAAQSLTRPAFRETEPLTASRRRIRRLPEARGGGRRLRAFIHSALRLAPVSGLSAPVLARPIKKAGVEVGVSEGVGLQSRSLKLPALRFRGKIMLGFAVVLAISAVSMGIAYLGFDRVSQGVASYRNSVSEADLARNIDRELISYRALARYFVVTAKEDDGKAALAAEASLRDVIDRAMKGTTNPARREQVARLDQEFRAFAKIFADRINDQH